MIKLRDCVVSSYQSRPEKKTTSDQNPSYMHKMVMMGVLKSKCYKQELVFAVAYLLNFFFPLGFSTLYICK